MPCVAILGPLLFPENKKNWKLISGLSYRWASKPNWPNPLSSSPATPLPRVKHSSPISQLLYFELRTTYRIGVHCKKGETEQKWLTGFWFDCLWKIHKCLGIQICLCRNTYYLQLTWNKPLNTWMLLSSFTVCQSYGMWTVPNHESVHLHPQISHSTSTKSCTPVSNLSKT